MSGIEPPFSAWEADVIATIRHPQKLKKAFLHLLFIFNYTTIKLKQNPHINKSFCLYKTIYLLSGDFVYLVFIHLD